MTHVKGLSIQIFSWAFCALFLISCHSSNDVVSSYGKRKYTKGWFLFKHGKVDSKSAAGKDSTLTHNYKTVNTPENITPAPVPGIEEQERTPHQKRRAKRDSLKRLAQNKAVVSTTNKEDKVKTKGPPEPPDDIYLKLLVLILVLTGLSILFTGLITPIVVWGITQDFMLGVGVILTFIAYLISVNTTLGITSTVPSDKPYNLGKPAWILSLWATIPMLLLYFVAKTALKANLAMLEVLTIGLFFAGACVLLSLILAIKALFVKDRHTGKAVLALLIDALLIGEVVFLLI